MRYVGSKRRLAKDLLPIILKDRKPDQFYIEPFCGGCNLIDKVSGNRIASDINKYLIALFRALQRGWQPPSLISREVYNLIRKDKEQYPDELVCFIGFCCSFGAQFLSGYAFDNINTNYAERGRNVLLKQIKNLQDVKFENKEYFELEIPPKSIIYCDPPYAGTEHYYNVQFNYDKFWQWCRDKTEDGHKVYISSYEAPNDFKCIFEKEITVPLNNRKNNNKKHDKRIERLFIYER